MPGGQVEMPSHQSRFSFTAANENGRVGEVRKLGEDQAWAGVAVGVKTLPTVFLQSQEEAFLSASSVGRTLEHIRGGPMA